jgi:hypothetical protein
MKKYLKFIITAALMLAVSSNGCKKSKDAEAELNLSATSLTFAAAGETKSIDVKSNVEWSISGQPAWLTVKPASGKGSVKVEVTASENAATTVRTAEPHRVREGQKRTGKSNAGSGCHANGRKSRRHRHHARRSGICGSG